MLEFKMSWIKKVNDTKGQSLFEFILFLPILTILLILIITVISSINASINQEKATRGYFYYLLKGNSYIPPYEDLKTYQSGSLRNVGLYTIGWREKKQGVISFAPCFKIQQFLGGTSAEDCDNVLAGEHATNFIRIYTMYGVCGETVVLSDGMIRINSEANGYSASCSLQ